MALHRVWLIPLATFLFSISAFVVGYIIAVSLGHVNAIWPYISDGGTEAPESCIFGQLLNLAALFLAISIYLRHRQIVEYYWHHLQKDGQWRRASLGLLWCGYLAAFGMSMVANFQETNVILGHYTGALMAFGFGLIYCWGQTVFSYVISPRLSHPIVSHVRLALCLAATIFFFTMIIFGPIMGKLPASYRGTGLNYWTPDTPHYIDHIIGTTSEWLMAIVFEVYILSFAIELRNARCHAPKLQLTDMEDPLEQKAKISASATRITFLNEV
uniref:DNA damage-regulated autophagy modulator protein 2 n=1 Tax=Plectus sambesii TaxID=2011161 RepID=A0A914WH43_9BILA